MKICLITHVADPDGAGPIILSKLVFNNLEHYSCELTDVDKVLKTILLNEKNYDYIFITDLNISESMADEINRDINLKNKIKVFDHHQSALMMNKYSFIKVVVNDGEYYECGTSIYFKYLKELTKKKILNKPCVNKFVDLIRQLDTYHFTDKETSLAIDTLYNIYGRELFIEKYYQYLLRNKHFKFNKEEKLLLEIENRRVEKYVDDKLKNIIKMEIQGIKVGIVFAEKNRSIIGNRMASENEDIDIAVIININRSVSYRSTKENVDINTLASVYNGGGHKHAGGSPIPENLKEKIIDYIFK